MCKLPGITNRFTVGRDQIETEDKWIWKKIQGVARKKQQSSLINPNQPEIKLYAFSFPDPVNTLLCDEVWSVKCFV